MLTVEVDLIAAVTLRLGMTPAAPVTALRHEVGDWGLPPVRGSQAFVLDLNADWRSSFGGLLLFSDEGRLEGWRPEPGALTVFATARPPLLTAVTPAAVAARLCLFGALS